MASKSKRRRKVLGASCILAALIVAGSSFAWFTSKDEVTNRLSANADYGVSIVESFAPPKNWLPGQEVDKDVYATNTGNIGAFVEEDVKGTLTVTVEKDVVAWDAGCVELTPAERYSVEAGSYLALAPATSQKKPGDQVVAVDPANEAYTPGTSDFAPDVDGLYVFRRNIDVDSTTGVETFKYEGYYFKNSKYYKVKLTSVTPDDTVDYANDGVNTDGNLTAAAATYFKEETKVLDPTALVYDADNNRLVATYDTGKSTASTLTAAAAAYDDAIAAYERAAEAVARATNDSNATGTELTAKKADLDAKYADLQAKLADEKAKKIALDNATAAYNQAEAAKIAAQNAVTASQNLLYGATGSSTSPESGSLLKNYQDATAARVSANGRDQFESDFTTWANSHPNLKGTSALADYTYEEFMNFVPVADNQVYFERVAAEKQAKEAYEAELTKLHGGTDLSVDPTATSLKGKLAAANNVFNNASTAKATANTNYNNAVEARTSAQNVYDAALAEYEAALTASNADTTNLKTAQAKLAAATAAKKAAEAAYEAANSATPSDGILKINIKLSDNVVTAGGVADKWQLAPNPIVDNVAKFYYTSILEGGETSSKLVDSVKLDDSVTADMYKSFDFELNVALKSAQITYADDNETILPDAATQEIGRTPTLTNPTDINTALTW